MPPALSSIVGKKFLFKLNVEKENFQYKHDTYKIMKIITNKDLIEEFEQFGSSNVLDLTETLLSITIYVYNLLTCM